MKSPLPIVAAAVVLLASGTARAQSDDPTAPAGEPAPSPSEPAAPSPSEPAAPPPVPAPPRLEPAAPEPEVAAPPSPPPAAIAPPAAEPAMSEGRVLVSLYNAGFQWGISPGVVFTRDKASFAIGLSFGYGFDLDAVILVPGVRVSAYFIDPNVYVAMPTFKVVLPIDRFAPFVEGGVGYGHVDGDSSSAAKDAAALMGGGGFMIHFRPVAFGAEASYQTIAGSSFKGWSVGPILALGF